MKSALKGPPVATSKGNISQQKPKGCGYKGTGWSLCLGDGITSGMAELTI